MKNLCAIILGFLLVLVIGLTLAASESNDLPLPKEGDRVASESKYLNQDCLNLNSDRKVLKRPEKGLLWPDWQDTNACELWSKLSAIMAGFVFAAVLLLFQTSVRADSKDESLNRKGGPFGITISALLAAFIVFIFAADLFSLASGDTIEVRQQALAFMANCVLSTGLVLMIYCLNWALMIYQPHESARSTVYWLFWGMLVYSWTVMIPQAGDTAELIICYVNKVPSATTKTPDEYIWHKQKPFVLGLCSLVAVLPLWAALAPWPKRIWAWVTFDQESRHSWTLSTVAFAILAAVWCMCVLYGVRYTGAPCDPVETEHLTWFFGHHPRYFVGVMLGFYGLFSAVCVCNLPGNKTPESNPDADASPSHSDEAGSQSADSVDSENTAPKSAST